MTMALDNPAGQPSTHGQPAASLQDNGHTDTLTARPPALSAQKQHDEARYLALNSVQLIHEALAGAPNKTMAAPDLVRWVMRHSASTDKARCQSDVRRTLNSNALFERAPAQVYEGLVPELWRLTATATQMPCPSMLRNSRDQTLDGTREPSELCRTVPQSPLKHKASASRKLPTYAQSIYQALLNAPNHTMTLQDLFEWFSSREGEHRASSWRNTMTHVLVNNTAFEKVVVSHIREPCWRLTDAAVHQGIAAVAGARGRGRLSVKAAGYDVDQAQHSTTRGAPRRTQPWQRSPLLQSWSVMPRPIASATSGAQQAPIPQARPPRTQSSEQALRSGYIELVISDDSWLVLHDLHQQLHLRTYVFDSFQMLIWRHLLLSNLNLEVLSRTVQPRTMRLPENLVQPIASFLSTYGPALWPTRPRLRCHLNAMSRLSKLGYWMHEEPLAGPYFARDSIVDAAGINALLRDRGFESAADVVVLSHEQKLAYSPLGKILQIYIFTVLHRSLVDNGYERAINLEAKTMLHEILVADADVQIPSTIANMNAIYEESLRRQHEETGGLGGLPLLNT